MYRCPTWPESKSPVVKDLSLLMGRSKVFPSELSSRTEKQGKREEMGSFSVVIALFMFLNLTRLKSYI